ncbi:MAG: PP0621 family protein [Pseudomonadota bacterium]
MSRLLLLVAIAAVAWYLFRRLRNPPGQAKPPAGPQSGSAQSPITRCTECGVHTPESNGVHYQDLFFCCPEHLNDYVRKRGPQ